MLEKEVIAFKIMLVHGICPNSMFLGTMVPILKNKKKSVCDSDNYWALAISSIFGKIFDLGNSIKRKR